MELTADKFITEKEFKRLIRIVSQSKTKAAQVDLALYTLLWLTGMRISSVLSLEWSDVHDDYLIVKAENSKDGKKNTVYLGKRAKALLKSFKVSNPYKGSACIFQSQKGRINRSSAHKRLKQWLFKAELRDSIHLHSFRHSFALNALNAGVSLPLVKTCLHHKNISTTSTYLSFTSENLAKLRDAF